jgi:polyisoprenoid-binding protein YceI
MLWSGVRVAVFLFFLGAAVGWLAPATAGAADQPLTIGSERGTIDFFVGDSRIFRTAGSFKSWEGKVNVDEADVPRSTVEVLVRTPSIQMLDEQQTSMLKNAEFFDVEKFPEMTYRSTRIERTGENTLRIEGELTLRGITRPMTLEASVTDRQPDAATGKKVATFRAAGSLQRSQFGITKYVDIVGDKVDIAIHADAWRR